MYVQNIYEWVGGWVDEQIQRRNGREDETENVGDDWRKPIKNDMQDYSQVNYLKPQLLMSLTLERRDILRNKEISTMGLD